MRDISTRPEKLAWMGAAVGLFFLIASSLLATASNTVVLIPVIVAVCMLMIVTAASAMRIRLARKEAEESEQYELYRREQVNSDLFEDSDEALKLIARTNRHYVRYFVPVLTVLLGIAVVITVLLLWSGWNRQMFADAATNPLAYAVLSIGLFLVAIISGSFYMGASREEGCRWLRPVGAWMLFSAILFLYAGIVLMLLHGNVNIEQLDMRAAKIALGLMFLLGLELIVNFVVEFYRPRSHDEEQRPLYESRILALFTEPGGIARNFAAALDYQFGFQVSEVWFYRFIERAVVPILVFMLLLVWLLTCFVVVDTDEQGIRTMFGAVVSEKPLESGLYVKLPSPFSRIDKFPVHRVQEISIGYEAIDEHGGMPGPEMDPALQGDPTGRIIVWSKIHTQGQNEVNFIVASSESIDDDMEPQSEEGLPVNAYFLSANFALYFVVRDLYHYRYHHEQPEKTLEAIATKAVVRYLAGTDFFNILTEGRALASEVLKGRIQQSADEINLGIEVIFLGLQGLHPPVNVGAAFDEVVAAMEEKHTEVLIAEQYALTAEPVAEGNAVRIVSTAESYKVNRIQIAEAEAERFKKQLLGFNASPEMFVLRSYLDVLENEGQRARKYVIGTKASEIYELNLQEQIRPDLLDLDLSVE